MRCNMNFLNKMERKIGKYAIPNLMIYLIAAYCIGFVIYTVNPNFMLMLTLSPYHILHGQVWRLITWILMPTDTRVFSLLIMALLYYQLGSALERSWGTFRFNVYIFGGMLFTVIGAFILYGIYAAAGTGSLETISLISSLTFTTNYINLTIFLAFAVMYPEMQILLFFIIPVKMKWMAVVYAVLIAINLIFFLAAIFAAIDDDPAARFTVDLDRQTLTAEATGCGIVKITNDNLRFHRQQSIYHVSLFF